MTIQSIDRASQILGLFSLNRSMIGVTEIARSLNLNKSTVQGLVRALVYIGFLQKNQDTRKYQLGPRIYELGTILAGSLEINQKASQPADRLAKKIELLVRIAILDGDSALITLDAYPRSQPFIFRQFGLRAPLYCTAVGKALLAYLDRETVSDYVKRTELFAYTPTTLTNKEDLMKELELTRERGYSVNREEHFLSRVAIGAPIFGREGRLAGSMCISGPPARILGDDHEKLVQEVKDTSLEITRHMGHFSEV